jgi:hypothetical protein
VVTGIINTNGSIAFGEGFTVAVVSPGRYRLTFDTAFPTTPTVIVTNVFGSINVDAGADVEPAQNAIVDQADPASALIATADEDGDLTALSFGFIAMTMP